LALIATSDYYENGWPTRFQKAFIPRMHLQGKALQNAQHRVITSYCALCKPADGIFSQFFDFCRLTAGFESRMLFFMCQKCCFPAKIVPTYLQLLRTAIALPKEKSLLKVNT